MELETELTCCFTGHRPGKIRSTEEAVRAALRAEIEQAIADGFTAFITGMAPGVDTWAALEVLSLQEQHPAVQLVCAVPFEGVEKNRTDEEIAAFRSILQKAAHIEYVCKKRGRWNFIARDRWMVDHARRVIAVFNGTPGGTEYTLGYAQRKEREIRMVREG